MPQVGAKRSDAQLARLTEADVGLASPTYWKCRRNWPPRLSCRGEISSAFAHAHACPELALTYGLYFQTLPLARPQYRTL